MECRLCRYPKTEPWTDRKSKTYHYCPECGFIQLDRGHFLSQEEEQERYLKHNNTPKNKGYIAYLQKFIDSAVMPSVKPGGRILDFGSGPIPVLCDLLIARGFPTESFDPFFNNDTGWENRTFDTILAVEVFEHLGHPEKEIPRIWKALKIGGHLVLRTLLHDENPALFMKWWYREDRTHASFYSRKTVEYICLRWNFTLNRIKNNCEIVLEKK